MRFICETRPNCTSTFLTTLALALLLGATCLSVGAAETQCLYEAAAPDYQTVTVQEAYPLWQIGVFVLDVRTTSEFSAEYIEGAYNIPVDALPARLSELSGLEGEVMLVYCAAGGRSATASAILAANGFTQVRNMDGGIAAWKTAGYPTLTGSAENPIQCSGAVLGSIEPPDPGDTLAMLGVVSLLALASAIRRDHRFVW